MLNVEKIQLSYNNIPVIHECPSGWKRGRSSRSSAATATGNRPSSRAQRDHAPAGGKITFDGQDITKTEAHRIVALGMSHVPEGRRLFPNLSVYKNLLLGAYLTNDKKEIENRLSYVYSIFPILKERTLQKANTLSGGEQQMVAIGRGLMSKPKLLLLDEPSWGIAPILVDKIFEVIREIRKDGVTILLVEQDVQEALDICDRAYVIQTGKVAMEGTGRELLSSETIQKAFLGL
jgi:branched-chain amino acid transport system ATP-binding protein